MEQEHALWEVTAQNSLKETISLKIVTHSAEAAIEIAKGKYSMLEIVSVVRKSTIDYVD